MPVYATRRSASYPPWVYEASKANATEAELVTEGKGSVLGAKVGSPFPIPQSGVEVVWNHTLRFRGMILFPNSGHPGYAAQASLA